MARAGSTARPGRGRDGERSGDAGAARRAGGARARSFAAAAVPRRRGEGAVERDPPNLRARYADPALQVHKARNILARLPWHLQASTRRALRQAWKRDDAEHAETLLCTLARTWEHEAPGVAGATLEGLEESLTVVRAGPAEGPAPLARLHRHHRDHQGVGPPRLPRCHALVRRVHGAAQDGRRHARGGERFPQAEGQEPVAAAARRSLGAPPGGRFGLLGCSDRAGRLVSTNGTPLAMSHIEGDIALIRLLSNVSRQLLKIGIGAESQRFQR